MSLLAQAGLGLLGGLFGNSALSQAQGDIKSMAQFNPMNAGVGGGSFNFNGGIGRFNENAETAGLREMLGNQTALGLGGGMFNDPGLQAAFQNNDLMGSLGFANQMAQAVGPAQLASQAGQINNLGGMLSGMAMAGPQDMSGGNMGTLFSSGVQNQLAAGDMTALQNQELATMRAAAQPAMDRQFNQMQNRLHSMGMLGSTGGGQQMEGLLTSQNQADLGFQQEAFNRAAQRSSLLSNLGLQQTAQGAGLLGQNLGQFNQNVQGAQGALGLGAGLENQLFQNQLAGQAGNMSAGNTRLTNAMNIFGLGQGAQQQGFNQGIAGAQQIGSMNEFGLTGILGLLNAEANRIGSTGQHAQALGSSGSAQGGFLGGIMGGIGKLFSDARLKDNIERIGSLGDFGWYQWDWKIDTDQPSYGVIAQEVEKTLPEAVSTKGGYKQVDYDMILGVS